MSISQSPFMQDSNLVNELREVNLSYLLLAQRMLRDDFSKGMYRLGLSKDVAELLVSLSTSQVLSLASSNSLICGFRLNDIALLGALTKDGMNGTLKQVHASMMLAQQEPDQVMQEVSQ